MTAEFDVIVVGSGMTGGWAAKEFAEAGFSVAVIERGRNIRHRTDYKDFEPPWKLPYLDRIPEDEAARDYPVQSTLYAVRGSTLQYWNRDSDIRITRPRAGRSAGTRATASAGVR